ncbi:MAG: DNA polymerase I [Myxococcota bacterium]|nr:DNA polymerase I [Myxococcota bacterium]
MGTRKTLYLVDGSTYIFRAYFAMPALTNSEGMATGAIYGFTNMLLKLIRDEKPDYLAVVFDKSGKSFRNDLYPAYKANRPPAPEDLVPQFPVVREVTRAFNIPALELENFEADDIIATLATRALDQGVETVVVTSDKDLMQLVVAERCSVLDTMKDARYDPEGVREKMGVYPHQIVDFLALLGDSVDNIPGVPGIGKKTAATLLGDYESLQGIYDHIDELKGKRRENLEANREQAFLARELATVARDVPLEIELQAMARQEPNRKRLTQLFAQHGFKSLHRQFHDAEAIDQTPSLGRESFAIVRTPDELSALVATLSAVDAFALRVLTTEPGTRRGSILGYAIAVDAERAWYVPVGHSGLDAHPQLSPPAVATALGPLVEAPAPATLTHDAKTDLHVLTTQGIDAMAGLTADTMLASYLVDAGKYTHTLANIALDRLNHKLVDLETIAGKGRSRRPLDQLPPEALRDWACEQAQVVSILSADLASAMRDAGLDGLMNDLELPLLRILAAMEREGIKLDTHQLRVLSQELGTRAAEIEREAHGLAGEPFTLGSPKQLSRILFEVLGLTPIKKTKTGYSTNVTVLETLAKEHPLPALILEWRTATKLKSTYADVLPSLADERTGRVHTTFNQAVAATGRLSSTDPNLQNIPVRTPVGQRIRGAFVPEPGHLLLSADYSQIELRVLAHLTGDDAMITAFRDGADIHLRTAQELFGITESEVTRGQRAMAKTVNFGILYGMSAFRLANEQGISRPEAQGIISRYYARYPRIAEWKEATLEAARRDGHVSTLLGRIRRIPDINSRNHMARQGAERMAINTPVQGSAADIIKRAMIAVAPRLASEMPTARLLLQVHDELVFEVPEHQAEALAAQVIEEMEGVLALSVPLVANAGWGPTWLEAH